MTIFTNQPTTDVQPQRGRRPDWPVDLVDGFLALLVGLSVFLVHDVDYLLRTPFWLDEAWVASAARAPLQLVPSLTSSTPVGWTLLLRLVPFGGAQRFRLVPLAFAGLAAAIAYLLGRELRLTRHTTGLLTGAAALLSPAMLIRDDLKQYTAEACACLVIWYLTARAENVPGWRRLVTIGIVTCVGLVFAATLLFVGLAAMAALAVEFILRRQRRDLLRVAAVTGGMVIVLAAEYELLMKPHLNSSLHSYWAGYYIPVSSPSAAATFILHRLSGVAAFAGFRWPVVDALGVLAGIAALCWLRRYALAVLFPIILVIVMAASAAGAYPFGDARTSTFWLVLVPVLIAIAVAVIGQRLASLTRHPWVAVAVAAIALAGWVHVTDRYIWDRGIPSEDVRDQVSYVVSHFHQGDVIVVSSSSRYGFDYYYPAMPGAYVPEPGSPVAWVPTYPGKPWIVMTQGRSLTPIAAALDQARNVIASEPAGDRGRIWIIESHLTTVEAAAWKQVLSGQQVISLPAGSDPLWLYLPS